MAAKKLTLIERCQQIKRRGLSVIKNAMVDDAPPGLTAFGGGSPTLKHLKELSNKVSLSDILPYESYDEETQLFYNVDTVGFMVYSSGSVALSTSDLTTLNSVFGSELGNDAVIQVTLMADPNVEPILDRWANEKNKAADPELREMFLGMGKKRADYLKSGKWSSLFQEQPFLVRDYHTIISVTVPIPVGESGVSDVVIDRLQRTRRKIRSTMKTAGLPSLDMDATRFINLMSGFINPSYDAQPKLSHDKHRLINRQIVDADTRIHFGSGASTLTHSEKNFSVQPFHVRQFPQHWEGYKNGELIGAFVDNSKRLTCPFIATLTVNVRDQVKSKSYAKAKNLRATQMADSPTAKYVPEWKDRKADWKFASDKLEEGGKLHEAFYQIILISEEGREDEAAQQLTTVYGDHGWILSRSRYIPVHSFLGALPMGMCQHTKKELIRFGHFSSRLSWTCVNIAPWITEWKGAISPLMLFMGRRGQLAYFDPFANKKGNYNIACCARSGAGKSFVTQEWINATLSYGGRAFVIDAGHSYKELCTIVKGTYIDFAQKGLIVNPFTKLFSKEALSKFKEWKEDSPNDFPMDDYIGHVLPMLKKLLGAMASPFSELPEDREAALEIALKRAIGKHQGKTNITRVVEALREQCGPDGRTLDYAEKLALSLHSYTKDGMYGKYFEGENNIDLNNNFVVLDLDELNKDERLQSAILMMLVIEINSAMFLYGKKSQRKLCVVDEAWRLMGAGKVGRFIEEGFRVARKHGGSFMTCTQGIDDYFKTDASRAAYANSDFKFYLAQLSDSISNAARQGYLDENSEKFKLLNMVDTEHGQYSEIALEQPDGISCVRFVVDPLSEKLYSTQPAETEYIRSEQEKGRELIDILEELANSSRR